MTQIFNVTLGAAASNQVSNVWQFGRNSIFKRASGLFIQGSLAFGAGGSTVDAWVQTSFDGSRTWWDVAQFSFTNAGIDRGYNVSPLTPKTTPLVRTDGSLAANTCNDGIVGPKWRVKWSSTGTYTGGSVLTVDLSGDIQLTQMVQ